MTTIFGLIFLAVSVYGAWFTMNAFRPMYGGRQRFVVSFFAGWLTSELALHHIAWQAVCVLLFAALGTFESVFGRAGLWITFASWAGLVVCWLRGFEARSAVARALSDGLGADYEKEIRGEIRSKLETEIDWGTVAAPFAVRYAIEEARVQKRRGKNAPPEPRPAHHPDVERVRDITYDRVRGVNLKLDVYRPKSRPTGCPVLLEIHGGGWIIGTKNEQGIPLVLGMARQGWVCVNANYRLSPHATFPEHLIDLKKALAWIRDNIEEYGGDPSFVVVAGQSAGGHLASMMALTANEPEYQPGFENVDTRTAGCVSFYGVYDFTNRHEVWPYDGIFEVMEEQIMKASIEEDPEAYEKASPMSRISPDDPPFMVIHGDLDSLVPVEEARRFAQDLRNTTKKPVVYAEIPGAQHAFEIFPSLRSELVLHGVQRFLAFLYERHLREIEAAGETSKTAEAS